MNRHIKFRAWDTGDDYVNMEYFNLGQGFSGMEDCPIMQWTGLTDRNGKEIYEGDIVKNYPENSVSKVFFKDGSFMTYLENNDDAYLEMSQNGFDFKIIGNIYENPDLLSPTSNK